MFTLRNEQLGALRKRAVGDGLIKTFEGSTLKAGSDPSSGDVIVTNPEGNVTRFLFDPSGNIGRVTSPSGRSWRLENEPDGRLLAMTGPSRLGGGALPARSACVGPRRRPRSGMLIPNCSRSCP